MKDNACHYLIKYTIQTVKATNNNIIIHQAVVQEHISVIVQNRHWLVFRKFTFWTILIQESEHL